MEIGGGWRDRNQGCVPGSGWTEQGLVKGEQELG